MYLILVLIFFPLGYQVLLLGKKIIINSAQAFSLLIIIFFYILFSLNGSNLSSGIIINDSPKNIEEPLSMCMSVCLGASLTHATLNGRGLKHLSRI